MTLPSRSARSGTRGYALLAEIDVPVNRVWRALTEPALVGAWSGQEAEIDARKGGRYRIGKPAGGGREAHIDIFEADRRLRLIYLNDPDYPASNSAIVDDFLLDIRKGGTTSLRVLGSGVPAAVAWDKAYVRMRMSWEFCLSRMKATLEAPPPAKTPPPPVKDPPLPGLDF
jgi:uncharacterized protein YndB with AHSA1/START domain